MIQLIRKALPRRRANRVQLVNLDGSPVRPALEPRPLVWPGWTDNHRWEPTDRVIGSDSMGADVHESDCCPEPIAFFPSEDDLAWLAQIEAEEQAERARIERDYPLDRDHDRWLDQVSAALPPRNQVSPDELGQLAAHRAI
jgi:hypothetical protein